MLCINAMFWNINSLSQWRLWRRRNACQPLSDHGAGIGLSEIILNNHVKAKTHGLLGLCNIWPHERHVISNSRLLMFCIRMVYVRVFIARNVQLNVAKPPWEPASTIKRTAYEASSPCTLNVDAVKEVGRIESAKGKLMQWRKLTLAPYELVY